MKVKEIISELEEWAPKAYQESYDNSRLICGDASQDCSGVLISLDCTEEIVDEAIALGCNIIVSHHPIFFRKISSLTGKNYVERVLIKAIKNDVCLYALHTNLDNVDTGVSRKIAEKLGLEGGRILQAKQGLLSKLILYGTPADIEKMRTAVFSVGGGRIGNYSECSFRHPGLGTFKPLEGSNPTLGTKNKQEQVDEHRCEIVVPKHLISSCLSAARNASSYEELAYDVISMENENQFVGSGWVANLPQTLSPEELMATLKDKFKAQGIRFSGNTNREIRKVAVCGGSGFFLLEAAKASGAQAFITSDVKYHQFFDAENDILLVDIGHYESEQFTVELIGDYLKRKFPTFAVRLTSKNTNPVNYF